MIKNRALFFIVLAATLVVVGAYIAQYAYYQPLMSTFIKMVILSLVGGISFFLLSKKKKKEKAVESVAIVIIPLILYAIVALISLGATMFSLFKGVFKVLNDQGYHG